MQETRDKQGFDPWVRKIPWRSKRPPTPVFLPGKSCGQKNLEGYSPWSHKESDMTWQLHDNIQRHISAGDHNAKHNCTWETLHLLKGSMSRVGTSYFCGLLRIQKWFWDSTWGSMGLEKGTIVRSSKPDELKGGDHILQFKALWRDSGFSSGYEGAKMKLTTHSWQPSSH